MKLKTLKSRFFQLAGTLLLLVPAIACWATEYPRYEYSEKDLKFFEEWGPKIKKWRLEENAFSRKISITTYCRIWAQKRIVKGGLDLSLKKIETDDEALELLYAKGPEGTLVDALFLAGFRARPSDKLLVYFLDVDGDDELEALVTRSTSDDDPILGNCRAHVFHLLKKRRDDDLSSWQLVRPPNKEYGDFRNDLMLRMDSIMSWPLFIFPPASPQVGILMWWETKKPEVYFYTPEGFVGYTFDELEGYLNLPDEALSLLKKYKTLDFWEKYKKDPVIRSRVRYLKPEIFPIPEKWKTLDEAWY